MFSCCCLRRKKNKVAVLCPGQVFVGTDGKKKQCQYSRERKIMVVVDYTNGSNSKNEKFLHTML